MKKIIHICIFIFLFFGCNRNSNIIPIKENLNGFLGISWEDNINNSIILLEEKEYNINLYENGNILAKGNFSGYDSNIDLYYFNGKFYNAFVKIVDYNPIPGYYFEVFNEFKLLLSEKYGYPNITPKETEENYFAWYFENNCIIELYFNNDLKHISINYMNYTINEERMEMEKNIRIKDL